MTLPALGIDISKAKFDAALLHDGQVRHKVFANTPDGFAQLASWLSAHSVERVHACLEATGRYGEQLARFLHEANHTVSVVNPVQPKKFAESELKRNKTDKIDAGVLARFCQSHRPRAWAPPASEVIELQALVRRLEALEEMRQQEANRLESGSQVSAVLDSVQASLKFLDAEIAKLQQLIRDHLQRHPDLKAQRDLLVSIPGIAEKTAAKILSDFPKVDDFDNARQMAAFAGATPQQGQSGSSVRRKTRLSKIGSARLRKALYFPAIVAMRHNPIVKEFADRLRERGKAKMVIITAAMRKLIHIIYGVLKSRRPFDPKHSQATA